MVDKLRCPMCSKPNSPEAEVCEFCEARLKPLVIRQQPEEARPEERATTTPPIPASEGKPRQETDWLSRMRSDMEEEDLIPDADADDGGPGGATDLLGRLRELAPPDEGQIAEDETISSEVPFIDEQSVEEMEIGPSQGIDEQESHGLTEEDARLLDALAGVEDGLVELESSDRDDEQLQEIDEEAPVPDWLARIRERKELEESLAEEPQEESDWLSGLRMQMPDKELLSEEDLTEDLLIPDLGLSSLRTQEPVEPSSDKEDELLENLFSSNFDLAGPGITELPEEQPLSESSEEASETSLPSDFGLEEFLAQEEEKRRSYEMGDDFAQDFVSDDEAITAPDLQEEFPRKGGSTEAVDDFEMDAASIVDALFADLDATAEKEEAHPPVEFSKALPAEPFETEAEPPGIKEPVFDEDFLADLGIGAEDWQKVETNIVEKGPEDSGEPEEEIHSLDDLFADYRQERDTEQELAPGSDLLAQEFDFEGLEGEDDITLAQEPAEEKKRSSLEEMLEEFQPSWLGDAVPGDEEAFPHVQALIIDDDVQALDFVQERELSSIEIPDWLQDLGSDIEDEALATGEEELPDLIRATLPPWLEAMRPIETLRKVPHIEPEEEEIVEAAGPLAGLKGVLLAEPVMAMPRSRHAAPSGLDITESDYNQALVLQQMVDEEQLEGKPLAAKRAQLPLLHWACALLLILAVAMPMVLGIPSFGPPQLERPDFAPFYEFIQNLPADRPVLLVFDYEPGYSPEMDAVAGVLVTHLAKKGQGFAVLSTRPFGPWLASKMLTRFEMDLAIRNGADYLNLGYLSGGSTAFQLFITSPRESLVSGFNLPDEVKEMGMWESDILDGISDLSDFAMVGVLTGNAETARNWVEQLQVRPRGVPIVMVLSAGIEPLIRPYYEADPPRIAGLLTGLPTAIRYEMQNGSPGDATRHWEAYGSGILLAVLLLVAGLLYGIARIFIRPRDAVAD